ncbi:hypothetical protein HW555_004047 [Spodoptera exigua]|uniref:Uncharacterized protein n=1 Tax=Spodoptera exigua TaxID=7107 RepID=A0A835L7W3_SPOEX|nr:hypothetical protein HW555_004047 [Spodoptera exigua]
MKLCVNVMFPQDTGQIKLLFYSSICDANAALQMASRSRKLIELATGVAQIDNTQDESENAKSSSNTMQISTEGKDVAIDSIRPRSSSTSSSSSCSSCSSSSSRKSSSSDPSIYQAQSTKRAEYSFDTDVEEHITTNYNNISDDPNLVTSNMASINNDNYEEPLSSTNEHVLNDFGVIENNESSAIESIGNENTVSPIVYNSSPTKTGKKRRLNEATWKVNVAKRLRNSGKPYQSTKSKKNMPSRAIEKQWTFIANSVDIVIPKQRYVKVDSDGNMVKVQSSDPDAIFFKESYADELFKKAIVVRKKRYHNNQTINLDLQKAYLQKPGLAERKKADLMDLVNKNLIPRYHKPFYESL